MALVVLLLRAPVWMTIITGSDLALGYMVALLQLKSIIIILHPIRYCTVSELHAVVQHSLSES
jgi:hypothetical protein